MSGVLDGVDRLTKLAGHNRLELLVFRLNGEQRYGINVFKVQEVIHCPKITRVPESHPAVVGVANMRGKTIPVYDLSMGVGQDPVTSVEESFIVITEFNRAVQGFLVGGVDRIINMNWEDINSPPCGMGETNYLTAVTEVDNELVEILDVEKVLSEITGGPAPLASEIVCHRFEESGQHILIIDDSQVARHQMERVLDELGISHSVATNGQEAYELLDKWAKTRGNVSDWLACVISDVEMPLMDGYMLTTAIRSNPALQDLFLILHTSMSGVINQSLVDQVGADLFLPKYCANDLAKTIIKRMNDHAEKVGHAA